MQRGEWADRRGGRNAPTTVPVLAMALLLVSLVSHSSTARPGLEPRRYAYRVSAHGVGDDVVVKGWATFSGRVMAAATDPRNDGQIGASEAGAELTEAAFVYRPEREDFFIRLEVTHIPSATVGIGGVSAAGDPTTLYALRFTARGRAFEVRAHRFGQMGGGRTPGDHAFGLFECDETVCSEVAPLRGGYGTAGEKIVAALPLEVLQDAGARVAAGDEIGGLYAFTAAGTFLGGATDGQIRDDIRLIESAGVIIPRKSVRVTVGSRTATASLSRGHFRADFPRRLFSPTRPTPVRTRTCLGQECVRQRFEVRLRG